MSADIVIAIMCGAVVAVCVIAFVRIDSPK
jgi:hypothetical protein